MTRFNLICNGMMLFQETGDHLEIVIPNLKGHLRRICFDPIPSIENLKCLPVGSYIFDTIPGVGKLIGRVSPLTHLMVKQKRVEFDRTTAAQVSAIIRVPMPARVRLFRSTEPQNPVFPTGMDDLTFGRPLIHHDIVVFSYEIADTSQLSLQDYGGKAISGPAPEAGQTVNWELYSTEGKIPSDADGVDPCPETRFLDSLNDLLMAGGKQTEFHLDKIGAKDEAYDTGIGVKAVHMRTIEELGPPFLSGEFGCTSLMLAQD